MSAEQVSQSKVSPVDLNNNATDEPVDAEYKTLIPSKLNAPYMHLLQQSGKKQRTKLVQALNLWVQVPESYLNQVCFVIETLHNSSLLLDDIQDNSELRRGTVTAHMVFGLPLTINCGIHKCFEATLYAMNHFPEHCRHQCVKIILSRIMQLFEGQGWDLYWRDTFTCPTIEQYRQMINDKTSGLFEMALDLLLAYNQHPNRYTCLIQRLGEYFQIRDDYANLMFADYAKRKSFCEDLTEGKFSYPIIQAITKYPNDQTILNILKQRPKSEALKRHALNHMIKLGCLQTTLDKLEQLQVEIKEELNKLGGNHMLQHMLDMLYLKEPGKCVQSEVQKSA